MVGKTWDFHVDVALELDRNEYVEMIADSVGHATGRAWLPPPSPGRRRAPCPR
jgi:2-isopropylmalate synthase